MGRTSMILVLAFTGAWLAAPAAGAITLFNVSASAPGDPADDDAAQSAYQAAIEAAGYVSFYEGFTSSQWDGARSTIAGGTHAVTSVESQWITWHSSDGDFITTSDASSGVSPWHIYSKGGSPQEQFHAVPATVIGESAGTLYGIGMWVSGGPPGKGKLHLILDDTIDLKFEQVTGYDDNIPPEPIKETLTLVSAKRFYGAIVPQGFTKFQLLEVEGVLTDQVLMWAADFVFAEAPTSGDANRDRVVDAADYIAMKRSFGAGPDATLGQGDFNGDGGVDYADLVILTDNIGRTPAGPGMPATSPDPTTLALLMLGGPLMLRRPARPGRGSSRTALSAPTSRQWVIVSR